MDTGTIEINAKDPKEGIAPDTGIVKGEWPSKRYVVEIDETGQSYVSTEKATNVLYKENHMLRCDLWAVGEVPVNNSIPGDRSLDSKSREPMPGGVTMRSLQLWPDNPDTEKQIEFMKQFHAQVGQSVMPSEADYKRHYTMHKTNTLDCITVIEGEIYLLTDKGEHLMKPGDTVIIKGGNHGWKNVSGKPSRSVGCMIDALPLK